MLKVFCFQSHDHLPWLNAQTYTICTQGYQSQQHDMENHSITIHNHLEMYTIWGKNSCCSYHEIQAQKPLHHWASKSRSVSPTSQLPWLLRWQKAPLYCSMHGETQPQHAIDIIFLAKISTRKQLVRSRESLSSCSKIFFTDDRQHIQKREHHPRKAIKKALQDQENKIGFHNLFFRW